MNDKKTGFNNIADSLKTRNVKYGGYAAAITVAVVIGIVLINLLFGQLSPKIDLTSNKMYSLSEQTVQIVDALKDPVTIYGLWRPGQDDRDISEVLNLYTRQSKLITVQSIDPDKNPGFVMRYDKDKKGIAPGSLIVEGEKGFKLIPYLDLYDIDYSREQPQVTGVAAEKRITGALLFVSSGQTPVVYEITGHDETPLASVGMTDYITRENYTLKQINLSLSSIPADASAMIMLAPLRDINKQEADKLLAYLQKGGRLFILVDHRVGSVTNINDLLSSYGLKLEYGVVAELDQDRVVGSPFFVLPVLEESDITKPLAQTQEPVLLFQGLGISALDTKRRTVEIKPLLKSSPKSFLRTDLNSQAANIGPGDLPGPVTMAASAMDPTYPQKDEPQARLVVIGAGAMLQPLGPYPQMPGNVDLFMNGLTWLEDKPEALSIRSKSLYLLPMRLNNTQIYIFTILFVILIPLGFFAGGLVTWLKRRHL